MIVPQEVWWSPMVRQMAPFLKQHHPEIWSVARKHLAQWRPDDLQRLEGGPVLTAAQIHDITAKNIASLLVVVDSNGDVEARTAAFEDLKKIGLIEPEGKRNA
jgi:hypothetical protein